MAFYKDNPEYYVCKLSSGNHHAVYVIEKVRGFSSLRKGDYFDFSAKAFWDAEGQGRIWVATADYKDGKIEADETYNPEI